MKDFKFFQKGTLDDPQLLGDDLTRATASFHAQTPDGVVLRRRLYHTDRNLYDRLNSNNEMERYYHENNGLTTERISEITRRINGGTDNQIRLFQATKVTTVNPNWKTKIKMFYQKFKYNSVIETSSEVLGIFLIATFLTVGFILIVAKILSVY